MSTTAAVLARLLAALALLMLIATPTGLWVGSDGTMFGKEYHAGIGFSPLDVGAPDTTRPNTFIDSGPSGTVTETSATFTFSANEPATFQCRLDGAAFAPCTSPAIYLNLTTTSHSFEVAAADASYNVDASPAGFRYDIASDSAVVLPQVGLPDAGVESHVGGLAAYPFFSYFCPGAPLEPLSLFSVGLTVAGALRTRCNFEAALKWYELAYAPLQRDDAWARCS